MCGSSLDQVLMRVPSIAPNSKFLQNAPTVAEEPGGLSRGQRRARDGSFGDKALHALVANYHIYIRLSQQNFKRFPRVGVGGALHEEVPA